MNWKELAGWGLLLWGAAGVVNNIFMIQALNSGQAPTAALNAFDPATVLNIGNPAGAGWTSPTMLTDVSIASAGAFLLAM